MNLDKLSKQFEKATKDFEFANQKLLKASGQKLQSKVIANIARTGADGDGRLRKGVTQSVDLVNGTITLRQDEAVATRTDQLENGHKIMQDGQIIGWENGKYMYSNALNALASELESDAMKLADDWIGGLNG